MKEKKAQLLDKLESVAPMSIELISLEDKQLVCHSGWAANQLGYDSDEFKELSRNLFEKIVHPDDRKMQLESYRSFCNKNQEVDYRDFTLKVLRKDGNYDHLQIRISVLERDENGQPVIFLNIVMDVGPVIELKEKVSTQLKKLESISWKNSHDLRAPVANILGLLDILNQTRLESPLVKELIGYLQIAAKKLDDVIHQINEEAKE